mgnify:CR=1 FL=1|tara:strand:+ start:281 stop:457 length:177 start_codon:yes stop_codon:yes gene_type:complete
MELNQNNNFSSKEKVNEIKSVKEIQNLSYLYPIEHFDKHQRRWFKGSRDRGVKSDITA